MKKILLMVAFMAVGSQAFAARYCGIVRVEEGVVKIVDGKFDPYIQLTVWPTVSDAVQSYLQTNAGQCRCVDGDIKNMQDAQGAWGPWKEFVAVRQVRFCGDKNFQLIMNNKL